MPLLYGEGTNAFLRLQLELLNSTDDDTIFAWSMPEVQIHAEEGFAADRVSHWTGGSSTETLRLLARSPLPFRGDSNVRRSDERCSPHHMTSTGLSITLPLIRDGEPSSNVYLAFLNCYREVEGRTETNQKRLCLQLRHDGNARFSRLGLSEEWLHNRRSWARPTPLFITRKSVRIRRHGVAPLFSIHKLPSLENGCQLRKVFYSDGNEIDCVGIPSSLSNPIEPPVALQFDGASSPEFAIVCGAADGELWIQMLKNTDEHLIKKAMLPETAFRGHRLAFLHDRSPSGDRQFTDRLRAVLSKDCTLFVTLRKVEVASTIQYNIEISIERMAIENGVHAWPDIDETTPLLDVRNHIEPERQHLLDWTNDHLSRLFRLLCRCCVILGHHYAHAWLVITPLGILSGVLRCDPIVVFSFNLIAILSLSLGFAHLAELASRAMNPTMRALVKLLSKGMLDLVVSLLRVYCILGSRR
jgi:hypothetical protein